MSGGGFFYFYRTYTATVSGSQKRRVKCANCSCEFEYEITRTVAGGGHSAFMLNNAGAAESAKTRARHNLMRALDEAVEPMHCPRCGIYQPAMVQVLRERHGKQFDPNKYASARIAYPVADLWRTARAMNTKEAYTNFMAVWPTFDKDAKYQIRQLRYPAGLRKFVSRLLWLAWLALALIVAGLVVIGIFWDQLQIYFSKL